MDEGLCGLFQELTHKHGHLAPELLAARLLLPVSLLAASVQLPNPLASLTLLFLLQKACIPTCPRSLTRTTVTSWLQSSATAKPLLPMLHRAAVLWVSPQHALLSRGIPPVNVKASWSGGNCGSYPRLRLGRFGPLACFSGAALRVSAVACQLFVFLRAHGIHGRLCIFGVLCRVDGAVSGTFSSTFFSRGREHLAKRSLPQVLRVPGEARAKRWLAPGKQAYSRRTVGAKKTGVVNPEGWTERSPPQRSGRAQPGPTEGRACVPCTDGTGVSTDGWSTCGRHGSGRWISKAPVARAPTVHPR